ncbi:MAG: transcriptional repressor LexA [Planctomycetes bacterium]|nr:transcriptional repressor LexA [Planctomycetota bacterium]
MAFSTPGETRERVFRFVRERLLEGAPPTVREVQDAMGFRAVESARKQLDALVAEGRLVKRDGRARGYRLPESVDGGVPVPLVGEIQAGGLSAAIENPDGFVVASARKASDTLFALTVRGESMRDAGILPGDTVIVRKQSTAANGDIVVALVGDEATVKRLRIQRQRIVLEPANPDFESIRPRDGECEILGRVVELRRRI